VFSTLIINQKQITILEFPKDHTEDRRNDAENTALITGINIWQHALIMPEQL